MTYWQAVEAARERMKLRVHSAAGIVGPYSVADAVAAYLEFLEHNRNTAYDVRKRMEAHALPQLGKIEVASLTSYANGTPAWHASRRVCEASQAKSRSTDLWLTMKIPYAVGVHQQIDVSPSRRLPSISPGAKGKTPSDKEWRKVKPFEGADAARVRYLTVAECKRLLNACDPVFRNLVRTELETGARYGELVRLRVDDFNPDTGTIATRISKTGKPRHVILTNERYSVLRAGLLSPSGERPMLRKADGSTWRKNHQLRPMAEACQRARIEPPINFHALRHTWASLATMNGVPLLIVL